MNIMNFFKWQSIEQEALDWQLAKDNLIVNGELLPDGNKFSRKDNQGNLHSFIVIDRRILAIGSSNSYLGTGKSARAKFAKDENGFVYALKIITAKKLLYH